MTTTAASAVPVLDVRNLKTGFHTERGWVTAVDDISISIEAGKTLGLVGESGCGKSVTGYSLMRLIASPGRIAGGEVLVEGVDLLKLSEKQMRQYRGGRIAMVFQEPMTSLDPLYMVQDPLLETLAIHRGIRGAAARREAESLLEQVAIPGAARRLTSYPHQFSGGMRQRILIATALAGKPRVLVADEPTTALDVTVQAQILALLRQLQSETGTAILLITHNLGIVAENCHHVAVMYAGRIVERAPVRNLFDRPSHPYTRGLLAAIPGPLTTPRTLLPAIPGTVPSLHNLPSGCRFRNRCSMAAARCAQEVPLLRELGPGHFAACHFAD